MNTASPCLICSEHDHKAAKCPQLHDALKSGFFSGGGSGGGGHSHDEDEDAGGICPEQNDIPQVVNCAMSPDS